MVVVVMRNKSPVSESDTESQGSTARRLEGNGFERKGHSENRGNF